MGIPPPPASEGPGRKVPRWLPRPWHSRARPQPRPRHGLPLKPFGAFPRGHPNPRGQAQGRHSVAERGQRVRGQGHCPLSPSGKPSASLSLPFTFPRPPEPRICPESALGPPVPYPTPSQPTPAPTGRGAIGPRSWAAPSFSRGSSDVQLARAWDRVALAPPPGSVPACPGGAPGSHTGCGELPPSACSRPSRSLAHGTHGIFLLGRRSVS